MYSKSPNIREEKTLKPPRKYINPFSLSRKFNVTHTHVRQIPNDGWQKQRRTHRKEANKFFFVKWFCDRYKAMINVERIRAKLP